jgi:aspartate aminotransferase/aminotransferase
MDYLAQRSHCIDASGIRRIWEMASTMTDPVNFSIGEPDFNTPDAVKQAAVDAINNDDNGYAVTGGIDILVEKITIATQKEFSWEKPNVLITSGLSGALTLAMMALVEAGDEVLIPDPYFVSYAHLVNLHGGTPVFIDTYPNFTLTAAQIEKAITPNTKILMLNSPGNPTGVVYNEGNLKEIAVVARKHHLLVISDEIYSEFSYDAPVKSFGHFYENTMVLRGFSKSYGMPGWRLGYVAAPQILSPLTEAMASLQQYTFVCAPHPFQKAAVTALDCDLTQYIDDYRIKRDLIFNGLKDHFELLKPSGAFYAFVKAPGGDATAFVEKAIKNNVLIIPGYVFSQKNSHFRISFAISNPQIKKGIQRLLALI